MPSLVIWFSMRPRQVITFKWYSFVFYLENTDVVLWPIAPNQFIMRMFEWIVCHATHTSHTKYMQTYTHTHTHAHTAMVKCSQLNINTSILYTYAIVFAAQTFSLLYLANRHTFFFLDFYFILFFFNWQREKKDDQPTIPCAHNMYVYNNNFCHVVQSGIGKKDCIVEFHSTFSITNFSFIKSFYFSFRFIFFLTSIRLIKRARSFEMYVIYAIYVFHSYL